MPGRILINFFLENRRKLAGNIQHSPQDLRINYVWLNNLVSLSLFERNSMRPAGQQLSFIQQILVIFMSVLNEAVKSPGPKHK